VRRLSR